MQQSVPEYGDEDVMRLPLQRTQFSITVACEDHREGGEPKIWLRWDLHYIISGPPPSNVYKLIAFSGGPPARFPHFY